MRAIISQPGTKAAIKADLMAVEDAGAAAADVEAVSAVAVDAEVVAADAGVAGAVPTPASAIL